MRRALALVVILASCGRAPVYPPPPLAGDRVAERGESVRWTFDELRATPGSGATPPHPTAALAIVLGHWAIEESAGAPSPPNALCQRGDYGARDEPRVYATKIAFDDLDEEVACAIDATAACSLVAAARASDHYVVARADARTGTFAIVLVDGDDASPIAIAPAPVAPGAWHHLTLRVARDPTRAEASIDGAPPLVAPLPWNDPPLGRAGLAAGGVGAACFDDWRVTRPRT